MAVLVSAAVILRVRCAFCVLPGFSDDLRLCTFGMRTRLVSEEVTRGPSSSHLRRGRRREAVCRVEKSLGGEAEGSSRACPSILEGLLFQLQMWGSNYGYGLLNVIKSPGESKAP